MAYTQAQLDALEVALAQGALKVEYGDKSVTYRSLSEMNQIRNIMRRELGIATTTTRKYFETGKGLT